MNVDGLPDLSGHLNAWSGDLDILRQCQLLNQHDFWTFAHNRRVISSGEWADLLSDFHQRGWIRADGLDYDGGTLFHPFRLYPLAEAVRATRLTIKPPLTLDPSSCSDLESRIRSALPSLKGISKETDRRNRIVDLAVLLEPLYWRQIIGSYQIHGFNMEAEYDAALQRHRERMYDLTQGLDSDVWREVHDELRLDAAQTDRNDQLYLLLRLADAERRLGLCGEVGHALWLRHMAEVIRRGFEEIQEVEWPEEDVAFGTWPEGSRTKFFGAERPLDHPLDCVPRVSWQFGLLTGSVVRWYVEGPTEYHAILRIIPRPELLRVEIVNLEGEFASKGNAALKLAGMLATDLQMRRYSMVSFDADVPANVKVIRRQVQEDRIVGMIAAHDPDFEFANFTLSELVEIAARMDEGQGGTGDPVRAADWTSIGNAKSFEERYCAVSERRPPSLKGDAWGMALAAYAAEYPNRRDTGAERQFWGEIRAAYTARRSNYDLQRERRTFDPQTFQMIDRPAKKATSLADEA